jgi:potassium uptake TrkH family protein
MRLSSAKFEQISGRINKVMIVLVMMVLLSLILEYGFYSASSTERLFEAVDVVVLLCFIIAQIVKLFLAPHRLEYVRERNFEYALTLFLLLSFAALGVVPDFFAEIAKQWHLRGLTALFVLIAQVVIVLNIISNAVRFSRRITRLQIQPARLFIGSFIFVIMMGTIALLMPRATTHGIGIVDAVFTSTSAVCVTGLIVIDTASEFTLLGKVIILLLIQIGGLGLMTFTTFFTLFSGRLSIKERVLMQDFLSRENLGEVRRTLWHIVGVTMIIEAVGAFLLYFSWGETAFPSMKARLFNSIFHSVSAFCNAGFSLFSDNLAGPASAMNIQVNITIASLIILGGLGFITIVNIVRVRPWEPAQSRLRHRLSAHARIVLVSTAVLIVGGMVLFYLIEYNNTLSGLNWWQKILATFFQSVTTRTAGFNTIDIGAMAVPSTLLFLVLMFIGASPGSTGGGIKTTTASLLVLSAINHVRGKSSIDIGHRHILQSNVDRAAAALFFSLVLVSLSIFFVSIFEPFPVLDIVFECFSAMGTVGLSRGITFGLSDPSKIVLILTMLIGRVGAVTLMMALTQRAPINRFDYPTEQIMVG